MTFLHADDDVAPAKNSAGGCCEAPGLLGTQTQVMYRASLVRHHEAFYNVCPFNMLTCKNIWKYSSTRIFGFVPHQVLSFSRRDNVSILRSLQSFGPSLLVRYIIARRFAPIFFEAGEAASIIAKCKREYYRHLARAALRSGGVSSGNFIKWVEGAERDTRLDLSGNGHRPRIVVADVKSGSNDGAGFAFLETKDLEQKEQKAPRPEPRITCN